MAGRIAAMTVAVLVLAGCADSSSSDGGTATTSAPSPPVSDQLVAYRSGGVAEIDESVTVDLPDGPIVVTSGDDAHVVEDPAPALLDRVAHGVDDLDWDDLRRRGNVEDRVDDDHQWSIEFGDEAADIMDRQLPDPRPDLFAVLAEVLATPAPDQASPAATEPVVAGPSLLPERSTWVLREGEVDGSPLRLLADRPIRFFHQDGDLVGRSSCNGYGGALDPHAGDGEPVVVDVESELALCADGDDDSLDNPVMSLEVAYLDALGRATSVEVDGDEVRLVSPSSSLVFERAGTRGDGDEPGKPGVAPSTDGSWWLEDGVVDGRPIEVPDGVRVLFVLEGAQVSGQVGCNGYAASPVIDGGAIDLGPLDTTGEICHERDADLQAVYLDGLSRVDAISSDGGSLTLSGDGAKLTFTTREPRDLGSEG